MRLQDFLLIMACIWIVTVSAILLISHFAYGTAIEDKQPTLAEELLHRTAEWNIMTVINQTLPLADDFDWVI